LCADARVAVELDGGQHLASVEAIVVTVARMFSYRKTAISCFAFSPKTSAGALMWYSTQSCEPYQSAAVALTRSNHLTG